ncbi:MULTISPECIES: hypothetical protein [Bacteria]|uniref:hypothetical protein n=1 Tax=Bacteria TaxID=2 RepID=UPI003C7AD827
MSRRALVPVLFLVLAAGLAACTPGGGEAASPSGSSAAGSPEASGSPAPSASPTCETLIGPTTVDTLRKQGWTARQREFSIGPDVIPGGLECPWSDYGSAPDRGLLYGWAPISAEVAANAQKELVSQGWILEESDHGVYVTVDPAFAFVKDEDGYGTTYLFGDGWVTVSDTKQGLLLIDLPG